MRFDRILFLSRSYLLIGIFGYHIEFILPIRQTLLRKKITSKRRDVEGHGFGIDSIDNRPSRRPKNGILLSNSFVQFPPRVLLCPLMTPTEEAGGYRISFSYGLFCALPTSHL